MELSCVNKHYNSMIEYKHQLTLSCNHATAVLISYEEGLYKLLKLKTRYKPIRF